MITSNKKDTQTQATETENFYPAYSKYPKESIIKKLYNHRRHKELRQQIKQDEKSITEILAQIKELKKINEIYSSGLEALGRPIKSENPETLNDQQTIEQIIKNFSNYLKKSYENKWDLTPVSQKIKIKDYEFLILTKPTFQKLQTIILIISLPSVTVIPIEDVVQIIANSIPENLISDGMQWAIKRGSNCLRTFPTNISPEEFDSIGELVNETLTEFEIADLKIKSLKLTNANELSEKVLESVLDDAASTEKGTIDTKKRAKTLAIIGSLLAVSVFGYYFN